MVAAMTIPYFLTHSAVNLSLRRPSTDATTSLAALSQVSLDENSVVLSAAPESALKPA